MAIGRSTVLFALVAASAGACTASLQNRVASAVNAVTPSLVVAYESDGKACVATAKTRTDAVACVAAVDSSWSPVWASLALARTADDAAGAWCALGSAVDALNASRNTGALSAPAVDGVVCP